MNKLLVGLLSITLLWSNTASAQVKPEGEDAWTEIARRARNTASAQVKPEVELLVEALPPAATSCGITKSSTESIAALTLRNNGIQVVNNITKPVLYVQTIVTYANPFCFFSLRVSLYKYLPIAAPIDGFKPRKAAADFVLCESAGTFAGGHPITGREFLISLENNVKICLGTLDY